MQRELGLAHFWAQGDLVTHSVAILLVLLSVVSWYVIAAKAYAVWQAGRCHARALASFWGAPSLPAAPWPPRSSSTWAPCSAGQTGSAWPKKSSAP